MTTTDFEAQLTAMEIAGHVDAATEHLEQVYSLLHSLSAPESRRVAPYLPQVNVEGDTVTRLAAMACAIQTKVAELTVRGLAA